MAFDADVLAEIEEWAGTELSGEDYEVDYGRLGSAHAVALKVLRRRLANLLNTPGSIRVEGDFAQDYRDNLALYRQNIATLEGLVPGAQPAVTTGDLVRSSDRRSR